MTAMEKLASQSEGTDRYLLPDVMLPVTFLRKSSNCTALKMRCSACSMNVLICSVDVNVTVLEPLEAVHEVLGKSFSTYPLIVSNSSE